MKIPNYIKIALAKRVKAAYSFNEADLIVSKYINEHNLDVPSEDFYGGVEALVNPDASADRIVDAILNHKE